MLAAFQSSSNATATGLGAVLGVVVAVVLGYGIYRGGVRINLSRFFQVTGFVLVLVAAGLLASAVHSLAEAGVVTQLQDSAFNLTWLVDPGSVRAALLTGMLGLQPVPTVAEVVVWLAYAIPMSAYVLWPQRSATSARRASAARPRFPRPPARPPSENPSDRTKEPSMSRTLGSASPVAPDRTPDGRRRRSCGRDDGGRRDESTVEVALNDFDLTLVTRDHGRGRGHLRGPPTPGRRRTSSRSSRGPTTWTSPRFPWRTTSPTRPASRWSTRSRT